MLKKQLITCAIPFYSSMCHSDALERRQSSHAFTEWIAALVWAVSMVWRKDVDLLLLDLLPFSRVVKTGVRLQRSYNPTEKMTSLCI